MISDEERREVARRLREIREDEYGEVYLYDVMLALGIESGKAAYWADQEFIHHLADLIDRPTCSMEYRPEWSGDELYPTSVYECSVCGQTVPDGKPDYCPGCGAEVVPDAQRRD